MKLLKLRKAKGLTQGQLAELCGVSQQHIAKIERSKLDPKLSTLRRVAVALDCEVKVLIWERREFESIVNGVIARHKLKLSQLLKDQTFTDLTMVCEREEYIDGFHPFWSEIIINKSANKIKVKGKS